MLMSMPADEHPVPLPLLRRLCRHQNYPKLVLHLKPSRQAEKALNERPKSLSSNRNGMSNTQYRKDDHGSCRFSSKGATRLDRIDHSGGRINLAQARQYLNRGFRFCIRYISRTPESRKAHEENGTPESSQARGARYSKCRSRSHDGPTCRSHWLGADHEFWKEYGENAGGYASEAGLLEGVNVWLDLEDIPAGTQHQDIIDYGNAWFDAVQNSGYEPGVYIGFKVWLSPDELFLKLKFQALLASTGKYSRGVASRLSAHSAHRKTRFW